MTLPTLHTDPAIELWESIRKLTLQDQKAARLKTAEVALARLKRLDDYILASRKIGDEALALHDTVTAIQEGKILVASGTDPNLAITLDDLKEN